MGSQRSIAVPVVDGMTLFEIGMPLEALGYDWDRGVGPLYEVALYGDLRRRACPWRAAAGAAPLARCAC